MRRFAVTVAAAISVAALAGTISATPSTASVAPASASTAQVPASGVQVPASSAKPAVIRAVKMGGDVGPFLGPGRTIWTVSDQSITHAAVSLTPASRKETTYPITDKLYAFSYDTVPAFDGKGNLWLPYLAQGGFYGLERFTPKTGALLGSKIIDPCPDIYQASDGYVWMVCNNTYYRISATGAYTTRAEGTIASGLALSSGLMMGPHGIMWGVTFNDSLIELSASSTGKISAKTFSPAESILHLVGNGTSDTVAVVHCFGGCPKSCPKSGTCFVSLSAGGAQKTLAVVGTSLVNWSNLAMDASGNVWALGASSLGTNYVYEVPAKGGKIGQKEWAFPSPNQAKTADPSALIATDGGVWFKQLAGPYAGELVELIP